MSKQELIELFKNVGILNKKGMRKFCWRSMFTKDLEDLFNNYAKNYRSDDEAWFCLSNNVEPYKCEVCGNLAKFTGSTKSKIKGYNTVCENCSANAVKSKIEQTNNILKNKSKEERSKIKSKRKQTCLKKYGDSNYGLYGSESFKQMMTEKYGDPYYNNRDKCKKTCLEKYGVETNFQIEGFVEQSLKVKKERYGNPSNCEKTKQTCLERYGVEHIGQHKETQQKIIKSKQLNVSKIENEYNCTQQRKLINKYGQGWLSLDLIKLEIDGRKFIQNEDLKIIEQYSNDIHTNNYVSVKEKQLFEYIKSIYNGPILENATNIIKNNNYRYYELDLYLPELKLAFEFNGNYWHSDIFKDKYYHQRKLLNCYEQNIQLIHIYEIDWDNNLEQIKQQILDVILDVNNGEKYGWIPLTKFNEYELSEPILIIDSDYKLYNEGKFNKI